MNAPTELDPLRAWREGDEWRNAATGMTLRVEQSATASQGDALTWMATYPPYSVEPPLHFHPGQTERFTVLAGTVRVTHLGVTRDYEREALIQINPGEPHAMWNPYPEPATMRWETSPALLSEQWMGLLLALAAAGRTDSSGRPGLLRLAWMLHAYRAEFRLARPPAWVQAVVLAPLAALARLAGFPTRRL